MKVVAIKWIDENAKEAEVTISNGRSEIICFSQPFNYLINDVLIQPIYCFNPKCIIKSNFEDCIIKKQGQYFEYFLRGKIVNLNEKLIDVDGFLINLEDADLPGDLINGDTIEFIATRLDIY